jgi:PhzF family phenazine biosynthesis protein
MRQRPFKQMDVFTATPYVGNPLAVVLDGSDLSDEAMQGFARWNNLSETTFLFPPSAEAAAAGADYRVRIFTPGGELPFAGHPTLGSCRAWLESGGQPRDAERIVQECAKGLVHIRPECTQLAFAAPQLQRSAVEAAELSAIAQALGLHPQHIIATQLLDNGPVWLGMLINSTDTLLNLEPDHKTLKALGRKVGVAAVEPGHEFSGLIVRSNRESRAFERSMAAASVMPVLEVRAFAAPIGVNEDPVTGSLNGSLAQWLMAEGYLPERYTSHQGIVLGREGRVALQRDAQGQVWVGGDVVTCISGTVLL